MTSNRTVALAGMSAFIVLWCLSAAHFTVAPRITDEVDRTGLSAIEQAVQADHPVRSVVIVAAFDFSKKTDPSIRISYALHVQKSDPLAAVLERGGAQAVRTRLSEDVSGPIYPSELVSQDYSVVDVVSAGAGVDASWSDSVKLLSDVRPAVLSWSVGSGNPDSADTFDLTVDGGAGRIVGVKNGPSPASRDAHAVRFTGTSYVMGRGSTGTGYVAVAAPGASVAAIGPDVFSPDRERAHRAPDVVFSLIRACGAILLGLLPVLILYGRRSGTTAPPRTRVAVVTVFSSALGAVALVGQSGGNGVPNPWASVASAAVVAIVMATGARRTAQASQAWSVCVPVLTPLALGCLLAAFARQSADARAANHLVEAILVAGVGLGSLLAVAALFGAAARRVTAVLSTMVLLVVLQLAVPWVGGFGNTSAVGTWLLLAAIPGAMFALALAAASWFAVEPVAGSRRRLAAWFLLIPAAAVPLPGIVVAGVAQQYGDFSYSVDVIAPAFVVAAVFAVTVLRRAGRSPEAVADRHTVTAATALVAISATGLGWLPLSWLGLIGLMAAGAVRFLLPDERAADAVALASIGENRHTDFIRTLRQHRTLAAAEAMFYRDSAGKLASGKLSISDYSQRGAMFAGQAALRPNARHLERVLGSIVGQTPWESGLAGCAAGTVIGAPIAVATFLQSGQTLTSVFIQQSLAWIAIAFLHLSRWSIYGLIFGYFFPRLRGANAYTKAVRFSALLIPVEVAMAWPSLLPNSRLLGLGLAIGEAIAFALLLATTWEIRTARRSGVNWGTLRDLKSLRTLAAPIGAVAIAAVTALAAAFATVEAPLLVTPSPPAVTSPTAPGK